MEGSVLPSFGSIGKVVSEEKIFRNRPIRNKNCLWWPCLLTDRDEMSKFYRRPSIQPTEPLVLKCLYQARKVSRDVFVW
jgi:hypothetical protein